MGSQVRARPGAERIHEDSPYWRRRVPLHVQKQVEPPAVLGLAGAVQTGHESHVAGAASSSVVRVDPRSGAKRRIQMPDLCQDVAVGGGSVWAVLPQVHSVVRIDPAHGRRAGGPISVGLGPASIDYGHGSVWVANGNDGTVTRIDARTGHVVGHPRRVGGKLSDIAVSGRYVYVLRADGVVRRISALSSGP